jgi:excisionase family DNA binding protein
MEWMTVEQAASYFGVSGAYVRERLKKGWLDSYRNGYPVRLKSSEIDVFVLPFESL